MAKKKEFLENFKLQKALGDFRVPLNHGDKVHMFNCLYKVISAQDKGYTILEDEKTSRFAIPTPKLQLMMKKGMAKNFGALNLSKSTAGAPKPPSAGNGQGSGQPGPRGEPVGTTKQGSDGEWYKKVSDNPARWVHVAKGTAHTAPGSQEAGPLANHEDQKKFFQIRETIKNTAKAEDHEKLESLAMEWVKQLEKFKNLQAAANTNEVDQKGNKLPRTGMAESNMKALYAEHDKAVALKKKLIREIVNSKK